MDFILKRKSFATLIKCKFLLIDSEIFFVDITIEKSSSLPCIKIRTLLLMVAEKTPKLQGNPFFKSHRGVIPYIVCEHQCLFSKANRTTHANMDHVMHWSTFITCVCDVFRHNVAISTLHK